jgi:LTXXQ motif family protein
MKSVRLLLALAVAAPLAAQQPDSAKRPMPMGPRMEHRMMRMEGMGEMGGMGGMEEHMGMMRPMMRGMVFSPGHLLERKDVLELTPQQVTRLTALRDASKSAHDAAETDMRTHMEAMSTVMKAANPDTTQLKQHFQAMQAAAGKAHWAMLSAVAQARGVLTEAQRSRVEGWADAMQMHMDQMKQRMQPGQPEHEHQPHQD